jgi:hypothetical protein
MLTSFGHNASSCVRHALAPASPCLSRLRGHFRPQEAGWATTEDDQYHCREFVLLAKRSGAAEFCTQTSRSANPAFAKRPFAQAGGCTGGGYRAELFHLGALRRLNEFGILARLKMLSSVSGGSIVSAHLASRLPWPSAGPVPDWEERAAAPFRQFTATNIRTPALAASLLPWKTGVRPLQDCSASRTARAHVVEPQK